MKTDHKGVILPAGARLKPLRFSCMMRDYREHRKIMFHHKLLVQDWNHVNDNFDLDTAVSSLHSTLEKLRWLKTVSSTFQDVDFDFDGS